MGLQILCNSERGVEKGRGVAVGGGACILEMLIRLIEVHGVIFCFKTLIILLCCRVFLLQTGNTSECPFVDR